MKANSIDLLKNLNQKLEPPLKKGQSKFPRRKSDFVIPGKYPLYPFENFVSTVKFFSKAENMEKFDSPIDIIKSIIDFRDSNYADLMQKSEAEKIGLFFNVSAKKIKEGIESKIVKLTAKLKERAGQLPVVTPQPVDTSMPYLNEPVPERKDWESENLKQDIERLSAISRNLDDKKTYKLCEYDLERYGL